MIRKIIFSVCVFFCVQFSFAQKLKTFLKQGEDAMKDKDYYSACQYYNQAMLIDSANMEIQWKYAEASRLNYDFDLAKNWYDKIFKIDNLKNYPEAPYWIGVILKGKGQYKEAN